VSKQIVNAKQLKEGDCLIISPFNAIPSWEGYEYQGHVALFVILEKIRNMLSYGIDISTSTFLLEIEGAEDFSVKDGDEYLSLHQVKRGIFNLKNEDKFCFIISVLQYNAQKGCFHITAQNTLPNDFVHTVYDKIKLLRDEFSCDVKHRDEFNKSIDSKQLSKDYIIVESVSGNSVKGSKYSILKFVLGSNGLEINKTNIEAAIKQIMSELDLYEDVLFEDGTILDDSRFVTPYDKLFDDSSAVKEASYTLVNEILDVLHPNWKISVATSDSFIYPQFVYGQVLLFLKTKITECHENNESNCRIKFPEIFCLVGKDYRAELNSIAYQYYMVWNSIQESFDSYPRKVNSLCTSDSCTECADNITCNLHRQKELIVNITEEEIHSFLYRLMLKKPIKGKPNDLPSDELVHRLLTCLLKEIDILGVEKNHLIQAQNEGQFYRMTLNSSGEPEELQEQLLNEMGDSADDKLLLYETDILITDQLNQDVFIVDGISSMVFGENEYSEIRAITSNSIETIRKNYNKPKIMRLVDRLTAKEELK